MAMPVLSAQDIPQQGFAAFAAFSSRDDTDEAAPCHFGPPGDFQPPPDLPTVISGTELNPNDGTVSSQSAPFYSSNSY